MRMRLRKSKSLTWKVMDAYSRSRGRYSCLTCLETRRRAGVGGGSLVAFLLGSGSRTMMRVSSAMCS